MLKYNTLYQSLKKVSAEWHAGSVQWSFSWDYIKFFENNNFIYATINGDNVDQINTWFNQEAQDITIGTYFTRHNSQLILKFNESLEILAGFTKDGGILVDGVESWELFTVV
jgi:hypothetical protein